MPLKPLVIDARGEKCPMPVLRLEKALASAPSGRWIVVLATDPMAKVDIPLHCSQNGHACAVKEENAVLRFEVVKG